MANGMSKITVGVGLTNGSDVLDAQQRLNKVNQIVKTLSDEGIGIFMSEIRKTADKLVQDVYVTNNQLKNAQAALDSLNARIKTKADGSIGAGTPVEYTTHPGVPFKTIERKVDAPRGKIAEMQSFISRHGGSMSPAERKGFYTMSMPEIPYTTKTGNTTNLSTYVTKNISRMNSDSRLQRNAEEAAKESASLESYNARRAIQDDKKIHQLNQEKYNALFGVKDSPQGGDASGAAKTLSSVKLLGAVYLAVKVLHTIADIANKIYNGMSLLASRAMASSLNGMAVGMSGARMYAFENAEAAKGMAPGTYSGALNSIVSKFGNITKLDQDALKSLALVMGSGVSDLINSGMGGDKPEQVLDQIVSAFMEQALQGRNSIGQSVGVEKAMVELTEYLKKVDPNMAAIFQRQMYDAMDGQNGFLQAKARGSTSSWMLENSAVANAAGVTRNEINYYAGFKSTLDEIKVLLDGIFNGLFGKLIGVFDDLAFWLRSRGRAGMTDEAKEADVLRAREYNAAKLAETTTAIGVMSTREKEQVDALRKSNPGLTALRTDAQVIEDARAIANGNIPRHLANKGITAESRAEYTSLAVTAMAREELAKHKAKLERENASNNTDYVADNATNIIQSQWRNIKDVSAAGQRVNQILNLGGAAVAAGTLNFHGAAQMLDNAGQAGRNAEAFADINNYGPTVHSGNALADRAAKAEADRSLAQLLMSKALEEYQRANPEAAKTAAKVELSAQDMNVTVVIKDAQGNVLNSVTESSSFSDPNSLGASDRVRNLNADVVKPTTNSLRSGAQAWGASR